MISIKDFQFNMLPVNTYVVWDETKEAVVIDPGCYYPEEGGILCSFIRSNGLKVKHLLNTHLHFDHIYGNPIIENEFGVLAEANEADMPWLTEIRQRLAAFGIHSKVTINPIQPENRLKDGDTIAFGNTVFNVLQIPGHSPGSVVFYSETDGVLFTGDVIFQGSIGRTDFPDGNHEDLISGIRNKLMTLTDSTVIYPGHGPSTSIGYERNNNPYI